MNSISSSSCFAILQYIDEKARSLSYTGNLTRENIDFLESCCDMLYISEVESNYNRPMVWIGIYIAVASLICVLAMMFDLLHGFRNRKFWFPCKYFTLNATSITVITIAMKLPVDLNTPMESVVDLFAKFGSLLFMSTIMANQMPSLASMDNKELLANGIGLVILVITLIVNTLIQLKTGLFDTTGVLDTTLITHFPMIWIVLGGVIFSLMILISQAITLPTIKQILEFKYQVAHRIASKDEHPQQTEFIVEKLMQHIRRYLVMARTSDPEFVMASTPLCCAVSVINVIIAVIYLTVVIIIFSESYLLEPLSWIKTGSSERIMFPSDYKWSMLVIFIIQCIGIAVGNIAPVFRCFAALNCKVSVTWTTNHLKICKVEKYWIQKLSAWRENHISFPSSGRMVRALVHNFKNLILSVCIGFQMVIVVSCKMIELIPIIVSLVMYSLYRVKSLFSSMVIANIQPNMVHEPDQNARDPDISPYILRLQDETKLENKMVKGISNSLSHLIKKAGKKQMPNNLLIQLLHKSTGFEGVESFDSDQIQPLSTAEIIHCWSLPVVTLTCIAIAFPNIRKDLVDCLINSVGEGLLYTRLVEESLNNAHESVNVQKLTKNLWSEVDVNSRWLEISLKGNTYKGKTTKEIVNLLNDKAKEVVVEIQNNVDEEVIENSRHKIIVANSMYRITETLMLKNRYIIEQNREDTLFDILSVMIAGILSACLTNIPQVIMMKCQESVIEKREASVEAAAELLGNAKEIINIIQMRELPGMDPNRMKSIEEWRNYLKAVP
ncbi:Pentatricopeptide repeat-containing protein [Artemisia annua]|uniref:Pentatricopeptide repeat-containing protein n=1 Tax=Artemisia annua TaxID=35608 RepID=A0A2U1MN10_ARTAN|nr:Pentatricopeptide repeat-containing protein [Artemisia annua]